MHHKTAEISQIYQDLLDVGFQLKPLDPKLKFPRFSTRYYNKSLAGKYIKTEIAPTIIQYSEIGVPTIHTDIAAADPRAHSLDALHKLKQYAEGYLDIQDIKYSSSQHKIKFQSHHKKYFTGMLEEEDIDFSLPINKILLEQESPLRLVFLGAIKIKEGWRCRMFLLPISLILSLQQELNLNPEDLAIPKQLKEIDSDFSFNNSL